VNVASRVAGAELAEEQAALRRIATLVARGAPREEIFTGIASEIGHLFGLEDARMVRYEDDRIGVIVASSGPAEDFFPVGHRIPVDVDSAVSRVLRTGEPVRIDDYGPATGAIAKAARSMGIRCVVAAPISVEGRLWGAMTAGTTRDEPLPPETEARLGQFTELMATAVANAEARVAVAHLADEQAALRRVATLVAQDVPAGELFRAVAHEVGTLLGTDFAGMARFDADAVTIVASSDEELLPIGTRHSDDASASAEVYRTGRSVRVDGMDWSAVRGIIGTAAGRLGVISTVASPILVEGSTWGALSVSSTVEQLPLDTEERLEEFSELVATAISNAEARTEVAASRARIVAAADEERRRVVRDLHDGAQQRLLHTILILKLAQRASQHEEEDVPALLTEALDSAEQGMAELRELAQGILPGVLTRGGLRAGVKALASRTPVPVEIGVSVGRLPAAVEATAYFVVAEALTNVAKHAHAEHAEVTARIVDGTLAVEVRDDGAGGARTDGSGLIGLADRVAALDGQLQVESPADGGTLLMAAIPLPS
jgi:signal transduction histidine kinase